MAEAARGYSWEPFRSGNTASMRHGAWSPRRVNPIAAELVERVASELDWITEADRPAVWAWARAEAQAQLLAEYLASAGEASGDGVGDLDLDRVQAGYKWLDRAETRAARLRESLGLTPLSRARLGRDTAAGRVDMARLMAEERIRMDEEKGISDGDG